MNLWAGRYRHLEILELRRKNASAQSAMLMPDQGFVVDRDRDHFQIFFFFRIFCVWITSRARLASDASNGFLSFRFHLASRIRPEHVFTRHFVTKASASICLILFTSEKVFNRRSRVLFRGAPMLVFDDFSDRNKAIRFFYRSAPSCSFIRFFILTLYSHETEGENNESKSNHVFACVCLPFCRGFIIPKSFPGRNSTAETSDCCCDGKASK